MNWDLKTAYLPNPEHTFKKQFWNYRRAIDWSVLPHLRTEHKKQERLNIIKKFGRNSPFVMSMLYGQFKASGTGNAIFSDNNIDAVKRAMRGDSTPLKGDIRAAGDVSGGGDRGDLQILMIREGTEILWIDEHQEANDLDQADYWVDRLKQLGVEPWQFCIDGQGMGSTVGNYMELRKGYQGINRFLANNLPTYDFQFVDRYTELHWVIKEMLDVGVLKFNGWCQGLVDDMRARRFVEVGEKIKTEPKKDHRKRNKQKSPDHLDTLVYLLTDLPVHLFRIGSKSLRREEAPEVDDPKAPTKMEREALEQAQEDVGVCFGGLMEQPDICQLRMRIGA